MSLDIVKQESATTWCVPSTSKSGVNYTIQLDEDTCPHNCSLKCSDCSICLHTYSCSCADSLIRSTICKHMHLVARLCAQTSCNSVQPSVQEMEYQQETLLANLKSDKVATGLKERVKRALTELTAQISSCDDDELITAAEKHIKMAQNIIKATKSCATFPPPKPEPSNKQVAKQRPFFSTKKRKHTAISMAKPTHEQKSDISQALLEGWHCSQCQVLSTDMDMISCDMCDKWFHW